MANMSEYKTKLGGTLFASKYTLTSIDIVGKRENETLVITTLEYIIEGPTSAIDSRNTKYKYYINIWNNKPSITKDTKTETETET